MKLNRIFLGAVLLAAPAGVVTAGCAARGEDTAVTEHGTLAMALTAQTNGTTYRLRNGMLQITGPTDLTVSTETDPNLSVLATTLGTGNYSIELLDGWALEQLDSSGVGTTVEASLISSPVVNFEILANSTTSVLYQFQTNGVIVEIGTGTLSVSIDVVETTGSVGACDFILQTGCVSGEGCYLVDADGTP